MSIDRLVQNFHVAKDLKHAGAQTLEAGLDIECPMPSAYNENLIAAVNEGIIDEEYVDRSCLRHLELKFKLGLFENPYPQADEVIEKEFENLNDDSGSLEASRKAMTLVKNDGILPLKDECQNILVVGPSGNNLRKMWSSYTALGMQEMMMGSMEAMAGLTSEGQEITSVFDGFVEPEIVEAMIRQRHPETKTIFESLSSKLKNVTFIEGCDYKDKLSTNFTEVEKLAKEADLVIVTVGGKNGYGSHCTSGEGVDSANFGLPGAQEELLQVVGESNPNFIVVHTSDKPLVSKYAYDNAKAILEGWLCATHAGQAIAETIMGENNPAGRLQQDVPVTDGIYTYYYQQNASHHTTLQRLGTFAYNDVDGVVARPFGYGLSYTDFEYTNIKLDVSDDLIPELSITATITNTGDALGDEVVQLYGKDVIGSIIRPVKELIGFKRITLNPKESKEVTFKFKLDVLSFVDENNKWIIEAGDFKFFIGSSSDDVSNEINYTLENTQEINYKTRDFWAK